MPTLDRRARLAGIFLLFALLGPSIAACGGGSTEPNIDRDFVGSWLSTSVIVDGEERMSSESSFYINVGFWSDGSYSLIVGSDDSGLFCAGEAFCNEDGDYSFTNSVLTLDPGTPDSMSLQYSVSGDTLNVSGTVSGVPFTAVLERIA